jgi:hypothetical protein
MMRGITRRDLIGHMRKTETETDTETRERERERDGRAERISECGMILNYFLLPKNEDQTKTTEGRTRGEGESGGWDGVERWRLSRDSN